MSMARSTLIVGLGTVGSRLLGFGRDLLVARIFGAGPVADALLLALRIPNLVRRVMGEGGLNAGFVPIYTGIRTRDGERPAGQFAARALANLGLVLLVIVGFGMLGAKLIVLALAPGYAETPDESHRAAGYLRAALPFIMGVGLATLIAAWLNAERRFTLAALAPMIVNAVLIAALLGLLAFAPPVEMSAWLFAAAWSVAGLLQLALMLGALRGLTRGSGGLLVRPGLDEDQLRLLRIGLPTFLAAGAAQFMNLAATLVASFTPSAVSWLYYADRVFQLPLGFVAVAVATVILPEFARAEASGDHATARSLANRAMEASVALSLPASVALAVLALPIASVLFEHGAFGPQDSAGTSRVLLGMAVGLPFATMGKVLSQACFARGDWKVPTISALLGLVATVLVAGIMEPVDAAFGLGLGVSAGLATYCLVQALALLHAGAWRPDARLVIRLFGFLLASLVMGLAVGLMAQALAGALASDVNAGLRLALLLSLCGVGIVVYMAAAILLRALRPSELVALWRART